MYVFLASIASAYRRVRRGGGREGEVVGEESEENMKSKRD